MLPKVPLSLKRGIMLFGTIGYKELTVHSIFTEMLYNIITYFSHKREVEPCMECSFLH